MFMIFSFSNQESMVSSGVSSGLTRTFFDFFNLDGILVFEAFHVLFRKVVHFSVYFVLGILLYNALFLTVNKSHIYILVLTVLFIMLYAGCDEIHQLFVSGRSGEIRDVMIDTSGGSVGALMYYLLLKIGCIKDDL